MNATFNFKTYNNQQKSVKITLQVEVDTEKSGGSTEKQMAEKVIEKLVNMALKMEPLLIDIGCAAFTVQPSSMERSGS